MGTDVTVEPDEPERSIRARPRVSPRRCGRHDAGEGRGREPARVDRPHGASDAAAPSIAERGATWVVSPRSSLPRVPLALGPSGRFPAARGRERRARRRSDRGVLLVVAATRPPDLHARLLALGFEEGWQAHWMAIELDRLRPAGVPHGVVVAEAGEGWTPTTLPYDGVESTSARHVLARARPRRVWHVGAWRDGRPVAHAVVSVTAGRLGVAGLYDVGVERAERRRGIGRAVTLAALGVARSLGCGVATLNATPEGEALYRAMGFRSVGVAQTWWLHLAR